MIEYMQSLYKSFTTREMGKTVSDSAQNFIQSQLLLLAAIGGKAACSDLVSCKAIKKRVNISMRAKRQNPRCNVVIG